MPFEELHHIGRRRSNAEELAMGPNKESRERQAVDRGHGVARALETYLLNAHQDEKVEDMSLVRDGFTPLIVGFIASCEKDQRTSGTGVETSYE
jgi:hypothetical protein